MNGFAEKHIKFFDSIVLFVDYWKKNSNLTVDFVFQSLPDQSKAVFKFSANNPEDQLALFRHHVLRHFGSMPDTTTIVFTSPNIIEVLMVVNDGSQNEQSQ